MQGSPLVKGCWLLNAISSLQDLSWLVRHVRNACPACIGLLEDWVLQYNARMLLVEHIWITAFGPLHTLSCVRICLGIKRIVYRSLMVPTSLSLWQHHLITELWHGKSGESFVRLKPIVRDLTLCLKISSWLIPATYAHLKRCSGNGSALQLKGYFWGLLVQHILFIRLLRLLSWLHVSVMVLMYRSWHRALLSIVHLVTSTAYRVAIWAVGPAWLAHYIKTGVMMVRRERPFAFLWLTVNV